MKVRELVVLIGGTEAGRVRQDDRGRLALTYDGKWRELDDAVPLSLSMPLAAKRHGHDVIHAYLWGLLPDNERVLERWGREFHVSAGNALAILSHVGEDCAGAVQFVVPERVETIRSQGEMQVAWLEEEEVETRLRALREDQAAWRLAEDQGQFSLAGSQPKTALLHLGGRWGVPAGRTPTTHILKPPLRGLDGHVENEHFCLLLARALGLAAAESEVRRFGDEVAIVVSRYDRLRVATVPPILRVHQEDMCQALGIRPSLKYQSDGGPTPSGIVELLREHSSSPGEDVAAFIDALALNWLIGGTDAHAKNYSLLHGGGGQLRLAPLYDLASVLPYPEKDRRRVRLAMKVGSEYRLHSIRRRHWDSFASELGLDPDRTRGRIAEMATAMVSAVREVRDQVTDAGLDHPVSSTLSDIIARRATECARELS